MTPPPGGRRGRRPASGGEGPWIVALPAWGDRCVGVLVDHTLPALLAATSRLDAEVKIVVYTDQRERILDSGKLWDGAYDELVFEHVRGPDDAFESLSNCHRHAMGLARGSDRVCLLTADMVVSQELLETCEAAVRRGAKLVCCVAMRALQDAGPPVGALGPALLEWAWTNRHPMTRECTWPEGRSYDVWRMYYERDGVVAARVFLPHPLVVLPEGRAMNFAPTIDVNLVNNFTPSQTYMIIEPHEGAVVEVSPADKEFLFTRTMRERLADTSIPSCPPLVPATHPRHLFFFRHRVNVCGSGGESCGDEEVVGRVLGRDSCPA